MQNDSYIYKTEVSTGFSNGNFFIYNDAVEYVSNNGKKRKKIFFSEMSGITRKYSDSIEVEYQNNKIELFIFEKETVEKWYEILLKCKEQANVEVENVESMNPVEKAQEQQPLENSNPNEAEVKQGSVKKGNNKKIWIISLCIIIFVVILSIIVSVAIISTEEPIDIPTHNNNETNEPSLKNNLIYSNSSNTGMEFDCTLEEFVQNYNRLAEEYWGEYSGLWTINVSDFELTGEVQDCRILTYCKYVSYKNVAQISLWINTKTGNIIQFAYFLDVQSYDGMVQEAQENYTKVLLSFYSAALGFDRNSVYNEYWIKLFESAPKDNGFRVFKKDNVLFETAILEGWLFFNCVANG